MIDDQNLGSAAPIVVETIGGHKIGAKGSCINCGCSAEAVRAFGWGCKRVSADSTARSRSFWQIVRDFMPSDETIRRAIQLASAMYDIHQKRADGVTVKRHKRRGKTIAEHKRRYPDV